VSELEQYWTMEQVAERIHASLPSVKRWVGNGSIKKTKAGAKTLITETALQDFLHGAPEAALIGAQGAHVTQQTENLLTESQAADVLAIDPKKLQRWRWEGRGPAFVRLEKDIRYRPSDIEGYIQAHRCVPAVAAFMEEKYLPKKRPR
jgi:excisionase family DNA binding protein